MFRGALGGGCLTSGLTPSPDLGPGTPSLGCSIPQAPWLFFPLPTGFFELHYPPCALTSLAVIVVYLGLNIQFKIVSLDFLDCLSHCICHSGALLQGEVHKLPILLVIGNHHTRCGLPDLCICTLLGGSGAITLVVIRIGVHIGTSGWRPPLDPHPFPQSPADAVPRHQRCKALVQ